MQHCCSLLKKLLSPRKGWQSLLCSQPLWPELQAAAFSHLPKAVSVLLLLSISYRQPFLPARSYLPPKGFPFPSFICPPSSLPVLKRYQPHGFAATVISPLLSQGGGFQPCPQQQCVFLAVLLRRIISSPLLQNFCPANSTGCWDAHRSYS